MFLTKKQVTAAAAVLCAAVFAAGSASAGTITGTVTYEGKVPTLKPIAMDADPVCAKKHATPVPSDVLLLGDGNSMGNILVRVVGGLPAGKTWPAPKEPALDGEAGNHSPRNNPQPCLYCPILTVYV